MQYRREVDGLRAVAIIPVLLFHANASLVPGGFIGVDVFFVISGYLITSIIAAELAVGQFSITNFYTRRIRRLFPALLLVAVCCLPLNWFVLSPLDMKGLSDSLIATSLLVSNIFFWSKSGYFDTGADLKPLLHTWSLAVEEQFYLFFPLLLMAAWRWKRHRLAIALAGLLLASLIGAQWGAVAQPTANFYLLHGRAWELLAGAAVALAMFYRGAQTVGSGWPANLASGIGAALIAWAAFRFDATRPWPSMDTAIPVLGTVLILCSATPSTWVGSILGTKAFVGIGLISYSAYLWHQPLLAVVKYRSVGEPDLLTLLAAVLLALVLALATWRWVEQPIRQARPRPARQVFAVFLLGSSVLVMLGIAGRMTNGFERLRLSDEKQAQFRDMATRRFLHCFTDKMKKDGSQIQTSDLCRIGDPSQPPSFIVYGDSHAVSLASAFDAAASAQGRSGLLVATSACPPLVEAVPTGEGRITALCALMNQKMPALAADLGVRQIFLVGRWTYYTVGGLDGTKMILRTSSIDARNLQDSLRAFRQGLAATVALYASKGIQANIVLQAPNQAVDPSRAYRVVGSPTTAELAALSVTTNAHLAYQRTPNDIIRAAFHPDNIIDFTDRLCSAGVCSIGTESTSHYFDDDHLSDAGAARLVPAVRQRL